MPTAGARRSLSKAPKPSSRSRRSSRRSDSWSTRRECKRCLGMRNSSKRIHGEESRAIRDIRGRRRDRQMWHSERSGRRRDGCAAEAIYASLHGVTTPEVENSQSIGFNQLNSSYFEHAPRAQAAILPAPSRNAEIEVESGTQPGPGFRREPSMLLVRRMHGLR